VVVAVGGRSQRNNQNTFHREREVDLSYQSNPGEVKAETDVGEGSSIYNINPPSAPVEHLHKPKLRKLQIEALNQFMHFGTSFSQTNSTSKNLYNQYKNEQKENYSLKSLDLFDHVVGLLDSETSCESFLEEMWASKLSERQDNRKETFFNIVKYSLTAFHLVCRSPRSISQIMKGHTLSKILYPHY
jgi:hypothetical protein